jgi:hypothetical protein
VNTQEKALSESEHPTTERFSRRDILRRGAIAGGALLWIAPAVQTLAPKAMAHEVSPATFFCCECGPGAPGTEVCPPVGAAASRSCSTDQTTEAACQSKCAGENRAYCFHSGPNPITCQTDNTCTTH